MIDTTLIQETRMQETQTALAARDTAAIARATSPMGVDHCIVLLTKGQIAKVSPHRFEEINKLSWFADWSTFTRSYYAFRYVLIAGKNYKLSMHRKILGLEKGDPRRVDHINGDTLDNTDENLRIATAAQNAYNSRMRCDNSSGFKGVFRNMKRWKAQILFNGTLIYLGTRDTKEEAAALYAEAAQRLHGEFARTK